MRYWIYWIDLVQGPFELDELVMLRAFDENLMVCMEDRLEWLPAGRVADLAPAVELLKARRNPPQPPPLPPTASTWPSREPLQGDFFGEPPGQKHLFEPDGEKKGPYAFAPALDAPSFFNDEMATPTMPFRFGPSSTVVEAPPRTLPGRSLKRLEILEVPTFKYIPPQSLKESAVSEEAAEMAVARDESSLSILPDETEADTLQSTAIPSFLPPDLEFESTKSETRDPDLLPWVLGIFLLFGIIGSGYYWLMERDSFRSAIAKVALTKSLSLSATTSVSAGGGATGFVQPPDGAKRVSSSAPRQAPAGGGHVHAVAAHLKEAIVAFVGRIGTHFAQTSGASSSEITPSDGRTAAIAASSSQHGAQSAVSPLMKTGAVVGGGIGMMINRAQALFPAASVSAPTASSAAVPPPLTASAQRLAESTPSGSMSPRIKKIKKNIDHRLHKKLRPPHSVLSPESQPAVGSPEINASSGSKSILAIVPGMSAPAASVPSDASTQKPVVDRQLEAINFVIKHIISGTKITVGEQARIVLEDLHEKELLHSADTGERLYLPDKSAWKALRQEGSIYRVYLNFSALMADGNRTQARSYQFIVDLDKHAVNGDDEGTRSEFLSAATLLHHHHSVMADEIESLLSAVDIYNKHKLHAILVHKMHHSRHEEKDAQQEVAQAGDKLQREEAYFRTKYPEKTLQNVAKAYVFMDLLKLNG